MANELQTGSDPSVTTLVTGIIKDAQELMKQQLALFQHEIKEDLKRTREAALSLVAGAGVALVGALLLCFMLVHLMHWAIPAAGGPEIPLWVCFAAVGGILTVLGIALVWAGIKKFETFNPLPDESVEVMKENVQWIMNRK
jgi:uncharacterized membrane protein YqjE